MSSTLRVVELYSGIGGMHFALCQAARNGNLGIFDNFKVVAAIDINTTANEVYKFNFENDTVLNRQIQSLSTKELNGELRCDLLTMSPPCQPFTRQGKQKGGDDPRTLSFFHLLKTLPLLDAIPKAIFLENVKGFENSPVCESFLDCLEQCGYVFIQCLFSPVQFNVPNSRLRYYCLAVQNSITNNSEFSTNRRRIIEDPSQLGLGENLVRTVEDFLDSSNDHESLLDEKTLKKNSMVLDIVFPHSTSSCCFTKNYGRYIKGTGSVLALCSKEKLDEAYKAVGESRLSLLKELNLRLFTPREVASLMCFPSDFRFPPRTTNKERYHLLGNSVNVLVVNKLLEYLMKSCK